MGCGMSSSKGSRGHSSSHPEAYRIHRHPVSGAGTHTRRHSSVERHLQNSPPIRPGYKGKRYPHQYRNTEQLFPAGGDYYEFPTTNYPYGSQNSRGKVPGQPHVEGFTRTVTDQHRAIQGVMYHPDGNPTGFVRADEVYPPRGRRGGRRRR